MLVTHPVLLLPLLDWLVVLCSSMILLLKYERLYSTLGKVNIVGGHY